MIGADQHGGLNSRYRAARAVELDEPKGASSGLAERPSTQISKPVSALPPEMGMALVRPALSSVAHALLSYSFMVGKQVQNTWVLFLMHALGPNRRSAVYSPFKPRATAQFDGPSGPNGDP